MPKFELPKFEVPKIEVPKVEIPKIDLPKIDLKAINLPEVPEAAQKPLYAGVGATDLAVETVRGYVTEVQTHLNARVADVQKSVKEFEAPKPKSLQDKAVAQLNDTRAKFEAKLAELQADAKALPKKLQGRYDDNVAAATKQYADLAKRGETVVTKLVKGEEPKAAAAAAPAPAAKKAPAKKAAAKKAPAKKAAAKKAPAKKAAAK
ncbi:hypothetical protein [Nocardioides stalactiti]|uniref:hypothetical protein n=1 Tax=Nocardioides stalactiti TaxID=2755356 RepID=UPI001600DB43|nr:hypothetical protein [Nocardioides stalactiti]